MDRNAVARQPWPDLKVLITGGAGFIGSHLCRRLCEEGAEVHATSRVQRATSQGGPTWWQTDLADHAAARRLLSVVRPHIIYHLAGSVDASPRFDLVLPTYRSLLTSAINVLAEATEAGCQRIVLIASFTEPLPDQVEPTPGSPYAAAKWAASGYGRMFHRLYQAPVVIVRPFMVYGPAQANTKLIPAATLSLLKGDAPKLSSGRLRADWVYIADTIDAMLAAATVPGIDGTTIDVGSGSLVSIRSVVSQLTEIVGGPIAPIFGALPDRPGEHEVAANVAVAMGMLGWKATTPLESGLRETVEWYKAALGATYRSSAI
jgi:nucleoside-diphosphate-sugar epimerase